MSDAVLKVENLKVHFPVKGGLFTKKQVVKAVDGVSFEIYPRETFGLVGESGCGKSTTGRAIVKLYEPTSGTVYYHGEDVTKIKGSHLAEFRRNVQMIFQDPYASLNPRMTVGEIIREPMDIHHIFNTKEEREQRVRELLDIVGLKPDHIRRYPHEFSGGQRQRIGIARTLALNPQFIVCDEPVSALDVSIQAQVLNLFNRLQRQHNLTYIFISHDLGVIKHVSDRIAIMYLGRVVELCRASQIYDNPLHPYTKALLSAIPPESPFQKKDRIVLKGEIPSPIGEQVGCPLAGRCPNCMERCSKEIPVLKDTGDGHQVACFLYHDEAKA